MRPRFDEVFGLACAALAIYFLIADKAVFKGGLPWSEPVIIVRKNRPVAYWIAISGWPLWPARVCGPPAYSAKVKFWQPPLNRAGPIAV
jgi:hypothetical protein